MKKAPIMYNMDAKKTIRLWIVITSLTGTFPIRKLARPEIPKVRVPIPSQRTGQFPDRRNPRKARIAIKIEGTPTNIILRMNIRLDGS
jgi:hypothetical protein